jgi:uncharacterized protein YggE
MLIALARGIADADPMSSPNTNVRTIQVSGDGEAHAAPDLATLNIAIETHASTAAEAARRNAALAQKVNQALEAKLAGKGKTSTGGYSLNPEYADGPPNEKPRITGYQAQNSITVETGALDFVGPLVDTAIAAGANRIDSMDFSLRNNTAARGQAIANASKDAQAQAEALAASLGVKLGPVISASTESDQRPIPVMAMRAEAASSFAQTPVTPGDVTVPATVSLTYQIE